MQKNLVYGKAVNEQNQAEKGPDTHAIVGYLEDFGLNEKEAKVYYILSRLGSASANEIAATVQYNRLQTYRSIKGLIDRGLVETSFERPRRYSPLKIEHALSLLEQEAANRILQLDVTKPLLLKKWSEISNFPIARNGYSFRIVQGSKNVNKFAIMLFDLAEKKIDFVVKGKHLMRMLIDGADDLLERNAKQNQITIRGLSEFDKRNVQGIRRFLEFSDIRHFSSTDLAPLAIIDNKEVLICLCNDGDETIENAIWTNHPELVRMLSGLFNTRWSGSDYGKITLKQIEQQKSYPSNSV